MFLFVGDFDVGYFGLYLRFIELVFFLFGLLILFMYFGKIVEILCLCEMVILRVCIMVDWIFCIFGKVLCLIVFVYLLLLRLVVVLIWVVFDLVLLWFRVWRFICFGFV